VRSEDCARHLSFTEVRQSFVAGRAADAASAHRRAGRPVSVVDRLSVAIKDCFDVACCPTKCDSGLFANKVAALDTMHADALCPGGAPIVGKTVIREFGLPLLAASGVPFGIQITGFE
jgi:Asp-tRNA(Asn)/Glu-tRNA(Gln) amidotransferase A subunit family amidase